MLRNTLSINDAVPLPCIIHVRQNTKRDHLSIQDGSNVGCAALTPNQVTDTSESFATLDFQFSHTYQRSVPVVHDASWTLSFVALRCATELRQGVPLHTIAGAEPEGLMHPLYSVAVDSGKYLLHHDMLGQFLDMKDSQAALRIGGTHVGFATYESFGDSMYQSKDHSGSQAEGLSHNLVEMNPV